MANKFKSSNLTHLREQESKLLSSNLSYNLVSETPESNWRKQRDKIALDLYRENHKSIRQVFESTKVFLNMVIHDFRNPTSQIHFAIEFALDNLQKQRKKRELNMKSLNSEFDRNIALLFEKVKDLEE